MRKKGTERRSGIDDAFREESDMLLRWLTAQLGNHHDAEDVLQNCYARVLSFARKNEVNNPKALIFRTAANLAVDEMRRRKRSHATIIYPNADEERDLITMVPSETPNGEGILLTREKIRIAILELEKHPPNIKKSFLLNRLEGKTYTEIASILGVSVSAVEKYMIRAIKTLRAMGDDNKEPKKTKKITGQERLGKSDQRSELISGGGE